MDSRREIGRASCRERRVTGVQTCALPILDRPGTAHPCLAGEPDFGCASDGRHSRLPIHAYSLACERGVIWSLASIAIFEGFRQRCAKGGRKRLWTAAERSEERRVGKDG